MTNKSKILLGIQDYKEVHIKEFDIDVEMRPLSDVEHSEIEALKLVGLSVEVNPKTKTPNAIVIPLDISTRNEHIANLRTVELCVRLEGNHLTKAELKELKSGVSKVFAKKIREISGATSEADDFLKDFRKLSGGTPTIPTT